MFKNLKMLKGIVLALALVLVLGAGVVLKLQANAEANTVVFYVSDKGTNTTGTDVANAFTSFANATAAANKMKLAPGTELKLLVVNEVYVTDRYLDKNTVKDSEGNKIHVTIDSATEGEKATILHYALSSSATSAYERIYASNDITFKNIIIKAEVQAGYTANEPIGDTIDYSKLNRTRYFHVGDNTVEFDNCEFTSTVPEQSKTKTFTLLCDAYADSKVAGASHLRLLNGNYSNCTIYVQDRVSPLWDLSCYVENASVGTFYALADTDAGTSTNAKSVTCHMKDATVSSYNPQGRGHVGVTEGVTTIIEGKTVIKNWVACMNSSSSTGCLDGDLTYIFRDECSISTTAADSNSEQIIYLTPYGVMNGDLHVIVEGGTFNNDFCTGTDKNKSLSTTAPVINGNIYNEFKGGTFKRIYCGMGRAAGTVNGSIYNNFYDGVKITSTSYMGSRIGVITGDIVTNFYGGTVTGEIYMGGGYSESNTKKSIVKGDVISNIYGGTFSTTFWGGPRSQTVEGGVYTTYMGGTFNGGSFMAGGIELITPELHSIFKNGPDGQHAVIKGNAYLGPRGKSGNYRGLYKVGKVYNTFEGDVTFAKAVYCADGNNVNVEIDNLVQNEFKGGTFSGYVYCVNSNKNNVMTADVVNNFYDGVTFAQRLFCGGQSGGCNSITNNFYGGLFNGYVFGVTSTTDGQSYTYSVKGDVTNNFYGGTFKSQLIGAGMCTSTGILTNNFYGGEFKYHVFASGNSGNNTSMNVVNNFMGGNFYSMVHGGSHSNPNCGDITNNISGGHFIANHSESVGISFSGSHHGSAGGCDKIVNNISGGVFERNLFLGGYHGKDNSKVYSVISGGTFNGEYIDASMYSNAHSDALDECILEIKPDESENPLIFNLSSPDSNTSGLYGLRNYTKSTEVIKLYGAKKPIQIAGKTRLAVDEVLGEVTLIQNESWATDYAHFTMPTTQDTSLIKILNASSAVLGSAEFTSKTLRLDGNVNTTETVLALVGSETATAPAVVVAPTLAAINFVLDNNLQVNFYVKKADLEAYLANAGVFTYQITCGDDVLASGKIETMNEAEVVGEYVKIEADFAVAAFDYGKTLTLNFAGDTPLDYTVYTLLQQGMDNTTSESLVDLLKAIYNYGVEAEKLRTGATTADSFYSEIAYTGTYTGQASATSAAAGYEFYATSLSVGKEVVLNFYLNAASTEGLTFSAASAKGALADSRIVVTPFANNSNYNVVVSLKLDVASMDEVFTLKVTNAEGAELATCTNCVAYCCANYIAQDNEFAPISAALLAYIEKAQAI